MLYNLPYCTTPQKLILLIDGTIKIISLSLNKIISIIINHYAKIRFANTKTKTELFINPTI